MFVLLLYNKTVKYYVIVDGYCFGVMNDVRPCAFCTEGSAFVIGLAYIASHPTPYLYSEKHGLYAKTNLNICIVFIRKKEKSTGVVTASVRDKRILKEGRVPKVIKWKSL